MSYSLEWLVEGRVTYSRLTGNLTHDDAEALLVQLALFAARSEFDVHHICDTTGLLDVEIPRKTFQQLARQVNTPAIESWFVEIAAPGEHRVSIMLAGQIVGMEVRTVTTLSSAINFLRKRDQSLHNVQWQVTVA